MTGMVWALIGAALYLGLLKIVLGFWQFQAEDVKQLDLGNPYPKIERARR